MAVNFRVARELEHNHQSARNDSMSGLGEHPWQDKIAQTKGSAITMTKDDIQLLYEYDRWANNRVLQAVSTLSVEEFTRDLGGSFRSVRDTLVHNIGCEWGWLTIWKEPSPSSAFVTDLWTRLGALFHPNAFPDVAAVQLSGRKSRENKSSL